MHMSCLGSFYLGYIGEFQAGNRYRGSYLEYFVFSADCDVFACLIKNKCQNMQIFQFVDCFVFCDVSTAHIHKYTQKQSYTN